jgi:penicillin-binding protein 1A
MYACFVGYSTELVCAVWTGFDDALPLGWGESGAVTALPTWMDFMKAAHDKKPATEFPRPAGLLVARIDPTTGLLSRPDQEGAREELFLEGTAPTAMSDAGVDGGPIEDGGAEASAPPPVDPEAVQAGGPPTEPDDSPDAGAEDAAAAAPELPPF